MNFLFSMFSFLMVCFHIYSSLLSCQVLHLHLSFIHLYSLICIPYPVSILHPHFYPSLFPYPHSHFPIHSIHFLISHLVINFHPPYHSSLHSVRVDSGCRWRARVVGGEGCGGVSPVLCHSLQPISPTPSHRNTQDASS